MIPAYAVCNVYAAPLRASGTHRAEQTSQILFGEAVEILEKSDRGWSRVRCAWDGYEGWCSSAQLHPIDKRAFNRGVKFIASGTGDKLLLETGTEMVLPPGAGLWGLKNGGMALGLAAGKYKGKRVALESLAPTADSVISAAFRYCGAPYLWGGRIPAGVDCSGLIQMAFRLCGYPTPRDA